MIPAVADEPADPESWMQIAQTIVADLDAGVAEYVDGDHAGAASAFNVAYNTDYVASNFAKVVNDTIGADRYQNQRRQFPGSAAPRLPAESPDRHRDPARRAR